MTILVTGSLALDHIMVFEDHFQNHILPDKIHILNVAFFIPSMQRCFGGTAGNIAYNLRQLGEDPLILAAAGSDFGSYAAWLDECGIRRDGIRILDDAYTAQAYITTDLARNQIIAFHAGAMARAHEARLDSVREEISIATVSPNGKQAMQDHARELRKRGVPAMIDPGQGLPLFDGPELLDLLDRAKVYIVNDYEWELTREKTGLDERAIAERVEILVITKGDQGSTMYSDGRRIEIPAVKANAVVDPTGCGDAFRAGLLVGLRRGYPLEVSGRMGSLMGSLCVAEPSTQSIAIDPEGFAELYSETFGEPLPG